MKRLRDATPEEQEEISAKMIEFADYLNEKLGAEHDVVVLVHKTHEKGDGQCCGVELLSPVDNIHVLAGMLQHSYEGILGTLAGIPPRSTLN